MPALIHINSAAPTYLQLASQVPVEEARNGLVTVALSFVGKASDRNLIYPQFYVDAPPPVWPTGVDQNTLQTKQLYMLSHSYRFQAGLMHIDATYVGVQSRFVPTRGGFVVQSVTKEGPFNRTLFGQRSTLNASYIDSNGNRQQQSISFSPIARTTWNRFVYSFEFAHIDGQPLPSVTLVKNEDLVEILQNSSVTFTNNPNFQSNPTKEPAFITTWWPVADRTYGLVVGNAVSNENDIDDLTPSVKVIRQRVSNATEGFDANL